MRLRTDAFLGLIVAAQVAVAAPPKVDAIFPAGGQRGQSVAATLIGGGFDGKFEVRFDRPGIVATPIEDAKEKGKLSLAIAADAAPGVHWLRVLNAEGASSLRPFVVDRLPELNENEPNDAPDKAQPIDTAAIVNGKLQKAGDVDGYRVRLQPGQTLVAHVEAHSLGSPMDAALQLCKLVERKASAVEPPEIEAFVVRQNHDAIGLDPRIVFTATEAGDYLVRLFAFPAEQSSGISFAGGETFVYRLTLTTGPFVDHAFPPAVPREGGKTTLVGWNLPEAATIDVPALAAEANAGQPFVASLESAAGRALVVRHEQPPILAAANASSAAPQSAQLPFEICGRLLTPDEEDAFVFLAPKGAKLRLRVESRSHGFPLDSQLQIRDESGKTLQESDDANKDRDSELTFVPPADGTYRLVLRDLFGRGDARMVYRLIAAPVEPDFRLNLAADAFVLSGDNATAEVAVTIDRRDGFAEDIELSAAGLPAEISAEPVLSAAKGDTAKAVKLSLKVQPAAAAGHFSFQVVGVSKSDPPRIRTAVFTLTAPAAEHRACVLTVRK